MFSKSTVKYIQSLQHKKFRDAHRAFIAEGPKVVAELIRSERFPCTAVYATDAWVNDAADVLKEKLSEKLIIIKDFELEKISALTTPNQVLAVFSQLHDIPLPSVKDQFSLALDDIRDPGNLGTIIRIADWFGIRNIFCSAHTADIYNPKVVQSTMASLARVDVFYVDLLTLLPSLDVTKYAATLEGKPVEGFKAMEEGMLIIGNESRGIDPDIIKLADAEVSISRAGMAESLNAAVATGVLVYAMKRSAT